jgi:chromate transporter
LQEPVAATKYSDASTPRHTSLLELARLFLKLGIVAFGGPPAHIAMMEDEVVSRRGWLTREEFLDFLGATNLIPGPNSTEMAIHVGRVRAGWPGLLVAGASFILPSAVMVTALAWAYVRFGSLPQVAGLLYGIKPIVIALIVQAVFKLAKTAVKSTWIGGVGVCAALATALGVDQLAVLAGGGLLTGLACWLRSGRRTSTSVKALFMSGSGFTVFAAPSGAGASFNLTALFLVFLKIGAILFGGGYVISGPLVPRLRQSALAGAVLDGVNVAALALIAVATWQLFRSAVVDGTTLVMAALSLFLLIVYRVNSVWLVVGGALIGVGSTLLRS